MHVHPPKPLHGWKEFLNEIFVIVIGVLIALGFEQVVEELHWQHKVHEGEARLKAEAQNNFVWIASQLVVAPCIDEQIEVLEQRVLNSGDRLDPAPLVPEPAYLANTGFKGSVLDYNMWIPNHPVWDSLVADGTIGHMSIDQQQRLGELYIQISWNNPAPSAATAPLGELAKPIRLDPATSHALIANLESVRAAMRRRLVSAGYIAGDIRNLGWMPAPAEVDAKLPKFVASQLDQCRKTGRQPGDWRKVLAAQPTFEQQGL